MKQEIEYVYNKLKKLRFDFNSIDFRDFKSEYRYEPTLKRYVRKDDNDLFIDKNTFKPLEKELEYADKCHNLEEEQCCPLDVRCKVTHNTSIYDISGEEYIVEFVEKDIFTVYAIFYMSYQWGDYKKTWWLKKDKSE